MDDQYFDSAGVPIRYVERGAGDAVVLVHSYTSNLGAQWVQSGMFDALARAHRVIAFDLRGHGRSAKPHTPDGYGPQMALDIVRLLDHLRIDKAHAVGYSLGAHIVAQLLTLAPQRMRSAVLGGGTGRRDWTADDDRRAEVEAAEIEQGLLTTQLSRLRNPPPARDEIESLSRRYLAGQDCLALAAVRRSNRAQVVTGEAIAAAGVPVLAIVGSDDPYLASADALKKVMPALELVVVQGANHFTLSGTAAFAEAVERFLAARMKIHSD